MKTIRPWFGLNVYSYLVSLLVGGFIGYIGGPALVLIWWALIALVIGWFSTRKKGAVVNGAIYGFALAYMFMVGGYNGIDSVATKLLPFLVFGAVGAVCGAGFALIGRSVHRPRRPIE